MENAPNNPQTDPKITQSLSICKKEGIMAQVMIIITDYYLIPFGLFLGATPQQIGLLVAIPNLTASLSQLGAVRAVRLYGSRLKFLVYGVGTQAALLIPVGFLAFSPFKGRMAVFIVLVTLYRILFTLIGPAWGSLVSDYLPENKRGGYFGTRNQLLSITGIFSITTWGIMLQFMKKWNASLGFFIMFFAASAFRFASLYYMSRMTDLPFKLSKESDFSFWMFIKRFRESNFVKFVFYVASITFTTNLAAPYFSVIMLRDFHFSYIQYMTVQLAGMSMALIAFPIWGKHADVVGNAQILKITSLFIPLIPILWLFSHNLIYLVLIEMMANFAWGGFNLCATNFIFDSVSPEKRVRALGYFNLINGLAIFFGASLGGFLADKLPPLFGFSLYSLFLISGLGRLFSLLIFSRHFKEVRTSIRQVSSSDLIYSVVGIRPFIGGNRDLSHIPPIHKDWLK